MAGLVAGAFDLDLAQRPVAARGRSQSGPARLGAETRHHFRLFPAALAGQNAAMGTVHKFRRPPKNQAQFRGYRPNPSQGPGGRRPRWSLRRLRPWQRSLIAWIVLIALAAGIALAF
jgi:hypothetical protein